MQESGAFMALHAGKGKVVGRRPRRHGERCGTRAYRAEWDARIRSGSFGQPRQFIGLVLAGKPFDQCIEVAFHHVRQVVQGQALDAMVGEAVFIDLLLSLDIGHECLIY